MKKIYPSEKIYIGQSKIPGAGRGVFAKLDIEKGSIVERCPLIEIPKHDTSSLNESHLVTYFFYFGKNNNQQAIILGFGSIYNHSDEPNVIYRIRPQEKFVDFIAIKKIAKNVEITFNYRSNKIRNTSPLWFE